MEILSREYGWLPSDIRKQTREDIQEYINIIDTRRRIQKLKNKK